VSRRDSLQATLAAAATRPRSRRAARPLRTQGAEPTDPHTIRWAECSGMGAIHTRAGVALQAPARSVLFPADQSVRVGLLSRRIAGETATPSTSNYPTPYRTSGSAK
jgi:hypothetical protein